MCIIYGASLQRVLQSSTVKPVSHVATFFFFLFNFDLNWKIISYITGILMNSLNIKWS